MLIHTDRMYSNKSELQCNQQILYDKDMSV